MVVKKSALEVMETSFCSVLHTQQEYIIRRCFFSPSHSPHGFLIQSKEVLCFQIPSLLPSFAPFYKQILVALNIPPAFHHNSLLRGTLSDKSVWRMFMRDSVSGFLNKTSVSEPFCLHQRRNRIVRQHNLNARKSFTPNNRGSVGTLQQ